MSNCLSNICSSLYGNYRTRKFTDIYPDVTTFTNDYNNIGIPTTITSENISTLYYLLYAKYGNSHIANSDETQFKYKLFGTVFSYGPTWEKRLDMQNELRTMSDDDLIKGSKQIVNHSYNPSTAPSTSTLEELTTINEQNTNNYKRSKLDAYAFLWDLLATDVTTEFINKFKSLFLVIVEPQLPLWYATELNQEEDV